jgi:5-formyltetrahydrofolate cyclo-ligase
MVRERKKTLRKEIVEKRKSLTEEQIKELSLKAVKNLKSLPEFKKAKTIMLYFPVRGEVDLTELIGELVKDNSKILLLPKVTADGEMVAVEVKDLEILKKGKYGIPEPIGGRIFKPEKVDFVAVPGVAFDKRGYRLGMGKGFYDRFLPRVKGTKVGIAYDFQIVDEVPVEEHDIPLDKIVTPEGVVIPKRR